MFTSFSTALSALSAHTTAIDVVGNNLANLNTNGFKISVVSFHDLVTQSLGAGLGETQVGFGVGRPVTLRQFSQGPIKTTNGALDAAVQGDGFLIVRQPVSNGIVYTRGGNFQVDKDGNLLTSTGQRLQGWMAQNGVLSTSGPIADVVVPVGTLKPPIATTSFSMDLNLNAAATAGPPPDTFSTSIEVFDSLGVSHIITVDFTKNANPNEWDYSISIPAADVTSPITPVTGTLQFDTLGRLINPPPAGPWPQIAITGLTSGAADMTLTWNLFNGQTPRVTQLPNHRRSRPTSRTARQRRN